MVKLCKCGHDRKLHDKKLFGTGFCNSCACTEFVKRDKKPANSKITILISIVNLAPVVCLAGLVLWMITEPLSFADPYGFVFFHIEDIIHYLAVFTVVLALIAFDSFFSLLSIANRGKRKSYQP